MISNKDGGAVIITNSLTVKTSLRPGNKDVWNLSGGVCERTELRQQA